MTSSILTDVSTRAISPARVTNLKAHVDLVHCPVCGYILWKPVACSSCENSFCSQCVQLWLFEQQEHIIEQLDYDNQPDYLARSWSLTRCPFNCSPYIERTCPPLLRTILSKLTITCRHEMHGCKEILFYEQLEKHEESCPYQIVRCPGCQQEMPKEIFDRDEHLATCLQVELQCDRCQSIVRRKEKHDQFDCMGQQICRVQQQLMTFERKCVNIQSVLRNRIDILDEKLMVIEQVWGNEITEEDQSISKAIKDVARSIQSCANWSGMIAKGLLLFVLFILADNIRDCLSSF